MSRASQPTLNGLVPEPRLISNQHMKCISLKNLAFLQKVKIYAYKYIIYFLIYIYVYIYKPLYLHREREIHMHIPVNTVFLEVRNTIWERSGVPFHEASTTSASEEQLKTIPPST